MKKITLDHLIQIALMLIMAAAAIAITTYAVITVKPAEQFKPPAPGAKPAATLQPGPVRPGLPVTTPFLSRTPPFHLGTPDLQSAFPTQSSLTPSPEKSMVPVLDQTKIPILVTTALFSTQQALLTDYVTATGLAIEQTKLAEGPCQCFADLMDCDSFGTHTDAQLCLNYCIKLGFGDIHKLDPDKDGRACESR